MLPSLRYERRTREAVWQVVIVVGVFGAGAGGESRITSLRMHCFAFEVRVISADFRGKTSFRGGRRMLKPCCDKTCKTFHFVDT